MTGRRWLRVVGAISVVLTSLGFGGCFVDRTVTNVTNDLIDVSFESGIEPFKVGENPVGRYEHVAGTYRFTVKKPETRIASVGEFVRTADAASIRVDVVEMREPGTMVGVMCLTKLGFGGISSLVGYGFFVEPGGQYILGSVNRVAPRGVDSLVDYGFFSDPGGAFIRGEDDPYESIESLERGTDARIDGVKDVTVMCLPHNRGEALGEVLVVGFANGLNVASAEDLEGVGIYYYAGLAAVAERAGAQVRFTRVRARIPDAE